MPTRYITSINIHIAAYQYIYRYNVYTSQYNNFGKGVPVHSYRAFVRCILANLNRSNCANSADGHSTQFMFLYIFCSVTHISHITHHTSHITHHTSHITHHTSHITHHTSHIPHLLISINKIFISFTKERVIGDDSDAWKSYRYINI